MFDPDAASEQNTDPTDRVAALYRHESGWLIRFFQGRLRSTDDAHDLVQETMLRFLKASQSSKIEAPQHYLRRIASNIVRDHVERSSTRITRGAVPLLEDMEAPVGIDPHRDLEGRQELEHWDAVLASLNNKTREIFLLSRVDGWTYKEIAAHYGMTVWGVNKHMTKAIAHIDRNRRAA